MLFTQIDVDTIIPPRMRTRSAGRPATESLGGGTGERVGRGGRGRIPTKGCSYKEFLACNPKEYDGKGGVIVLTRWIQKLENEVVVSMSWNDFKFMMIQEFCPSHEMQKLESELWNHAMVGPGHAAYTDRFYELVRLVPHLISGALTDEAVRNGSIKKIEKRGNVGEPSKDRSRRDDNKRTRTVNDFATTVNPVGRENTGTWPKCTTCNSYHAPGGPCRTCFNYNHPGHLAKDCRGVPRNVNLVNARNPTIRACYECDSTDHVRPACPRLNRERGLEENRPNQVAANNRGQGHGNQGNQARGKTFMSGAKEARQDLNIMTGLDPSDLEIERHVFDIDLIPFGHASFDMIIGMDWLSNYKAEIIFHEKVVRIPLPDGKVLRVVGERPEEKARLLMSAKASDKKQEEIVVVRYFPEVLFDDLFGLPPILEIKFRIELIPGVTLVEKSPYHLAPSKMEEFSGQLKELQDKDSRGACRALKVSLGTARKGETEQELAFQTLKDKLCNAPILALPDGPEDFVRLFSDYDCEIRYHPGKANVVADALKGVVDEFCKDCKRLDEMIEQEVMELVLPGSKMGKAEHQRAIWLAPAPDNFPSYEKLRRIAMDYVTQFPKLLVGMTQSGSLVDPIDQLLRFYHVIRLYNGKVFGINARGIWTLDRIQLITLKTDGASELTMQTWKTCLVLCPRLQRSWDFICVRFEFRITLVYHSSVRCALIEALYGRKCRSPIMWAEVGEVGVDRPDQGQETTEDLAD
ncbi:putative reverse transcriptase domain-containing protein [Tanacetum coccineum]